MDMESNGEPVAVHSGVRNKKKVFFLLAISCLFILISMTVMYRATLERAHDVRNSLIEKSDTLPTDRTVSDTLDAKSANETQSPTEETFEATIIEIAEDVSYARMGVEGKGVLSFEIDEATIVTTFDGAIAFIKDFSPLTKVRVTAIGLPGTAPYDMRVMSISRSLSPEEERAAQRKIMRDMQHNSMQ